MANRVLSIEIGASSTQIVEVDYKTKAHKVYDAVRVRNPKDVIIDGIIQPSQEYAELIKGRLAEQKIKTRDCIFTISSTRIAGREVTIPNVKRNRIEGIIKANAQDYFPVDLDQYEIGYHMVGNGEADESGKIRVMALAVPKVLLQSYYQLAEDCGLRIVSFDYTSNSIYQILKNECGEDVTMVLKVDETVTTATVLNNGQISLQRTVSYGVEDAITIVSNSKLFGNINYNSAIPMLRTRCCINKTLHPEDLEWDLATEEEEEVDDRMKALKNKVTGSLEPVINSISRVVDYYNSRNSGEPIKKIYLTGVGGDFAGMSKLMTNSLEIHVSPLSSLDTVTFGRSMRGSSFGEFIACLGAVLDPVGLVDKDAQKAGSVTLVKGTNYTFLSAAVFALGIVLSAAMVGMALSRYAALKEEEAELLRQKEALRDVQMIYNEYVAAQTQYDKYRTLYFYTETPNEQLVEFMNELEEILPDSFYTNSFTSDENGISMTVTVTGKPAAARTIKNIREMESIASVEVSGITDTVDELGESSVTFSITGTYRPLVLEEENQENAETAENAVGSSQNS